MKKASVHLLIAEAVEDELRSSMDTRHNKSYTPCCIFVIPAKSQLTRSHTSPSAHLARFREQEIRRGYAFGFSLTCLALGQPFSKNRFPAQKCCSVSTLHLALAFVNNLEMPIIRIYLFFIFGRGGLLDNQRSISKLRVAHLHRLTNCFLLVVSSGQGFAVDI